MDVKVQMNCCSQSEARFSGQNPAGMCTREQETGDMPELRLFLPGRSWSENVISLSHAMRPGLQIRHFWVAKSLFLTITFNQKKQDKNFCF